MFLFSLKNTYERADAFEQKKYAPGFHYKYNQVIDEIGFGSYQYKIIATIALVNVSLGIFAGLLPFLIPLVKLEIEMETFEVGLLISAQSFGSMLGGLFFSYISDLKGRRISMLCGIATTIICSIVCTLFTTFYPFVLARFGAGIGYGGVLPVGVTYLTEYLPDHNRGSYLLTMEIFRSFGGLVCIFVAFISENSWRFFVLAPVVVLSVNMIIIFFFLPESSRYLLFRGKTDRVVELLQDM